jgi:nucleoside 2-deoxyribosyltransferase
MLKVYLAGYALEYDYRKICKEKYGKDFDLWDPIADAESKLYAELGIKAEDILSKKAILTRDQMKIIVELDKIKIEESDILVAYIERFSSGTSMEILHAWNLKKPVFIISPNKLAINSIWLEYHSNRIFLSIDECFNFLKGFRQ